MSQARIQRVAEQIKKEIGRIIQEELNDPRIGFVTITGVDLSPDLHLARVYFSFLGSKEQLRSTQIGLQRSAGYVRRLIGQRIKIRYTPEIRFKLDTGIEQSFHIAGILEKLKRKEDSHDGKKGN